MVDSLGVDETKARVWLSPSTMNTPFNGLFGTASRRNELGTNEVGFVELIYMSEHGLVSQGDLGEEADVCILVFPEYSVKKAGHSFV